MSDALLEVAAHWQQYLQLVLPVAAALFFVIVVYLCSLGSSSAPQLIISETVSTKKEKALARKKLKQQSKVHKPKPSNGHVVEAPKPQSVVKPETTKEKPQSDSKKSNKTQGKKSTTKVVKKESGKLLAEAASAKTSKSEAIRQEKAQMQEAEQGEWVKVLSGKEKKAKQAQMATEEAERSIAVSRQAIIDEANRLMAEAASQNLPKASAKSGKKLKTENIADSTTAPASSKNSKVKDGKKRDVLQEKSVSSSIPKLPPSEPQPDVRPKDPKPAAVSAPAPSGDGPLLASSDADKSLQEKLAEAMQPAFDELGGDWEEAKPLKMKNVKKRARRDK
ncbi:brain acid soluble protein 1 homolog [Watersipora subatra]|uniref:brain acid soluble protein 1 homolog n=1 Tax=Watersipora subatra TaxID=2589382 RepID=UPI00355C3827